jgi:serum amyloid A protein
LPPPLSLVCFYRPFRPDKNYHAAAGGVMSHMQGGNFLPGAGASFAGSLIGSSTSGLSPLMQATSSIAAGGFTSMAMGGKFMEGAINAGIVVGFNHLAHGNPEKSRIKRLYNELKNDAEFAKDFVGGFKDFIEIYYEMREANWVNSDKYFHSKANYRASIRGQGGVFAAEKLSNLREFFDQRWPKYDPLSASLADQAANRYGREQASFYKAFQIRRLYTVTIPQFRPSNLPSKY